MNALAFRLSWQFRRFQLPVFALLVFLQRTPVLRFLVMPPSAWVSAPLGQTLRAGALVATALGAVDTLAGATRFSANPTSPASATVGTAFSAAFAIIGANGGSVPKSYTVTNLAPGLSVTGGTFSSNRWFVTGSSGSISGTPTTAGSYQATVTAWENSNASGNSSSYPYTINVTGGATAPAITTHPTSQTVNVGTQVVFSVTASGTAPLTYTWFKGTTQVATGSSSTYTIASAQTTDVGSYTVKVSNSANNVTSNAATLTVNKFAQTITFAGPPDQGFGFTPLALSATASSGLTPSFTYISGPASLSGANLTLTGIGTVSVRADQAGDSTYAAASSVTRSFLVTSNYDYWVLQNFTSTEISAGTLTSSSVVLTTDGLSNLTKYALGLTAKTIARTGLPTIDSTNGNWTYTFTRPSGQTDITGIVEASTDLVNWSTTNVSLGSTSNGNGTDTWTATYPQSSATRVFLRFKATRP